MYVNSQNNIDVTLKTLKGKQNRRKTKQTVGIKT